MQPLSRTALKNRDRILAMRRSGLPIKEIAKQLRLAPESVSSVVIDAARAEPELRDIRSGETINSRRRKNAPLVEIINRKWGREVAYLDQNGFIASSTKNGAPK